MVSWRRGRAGAWRGAGKAAQSYGPLDCKEPVEQESPSSVTYDPKLSPCVLHFAALYVVAACVCLVRVCESVCKYVTVRVCVQLAYLS